MRERSSMKKILIDASSLLNIDDLGLVDQLFSLSIELFTTGLEFNNLPAKLREKLVHKELIVTQCVDELEAISNGKTSFSNGYLFSDKLFILHAVHNKMTIVSDESIIAKKGITMGIEVWSMSKIIEMMKREGLVSKKEYEKAIELKRVLYPSTITN